MFINICKTSSDKLNLIYATIKPDMRELVDLLSLCSCWHVAVSVLSIFFMVPRVCQQCVNEAFCGHTHLPVSVIY